MLDVPVNKILDFESELFTYVETNAPDIFKDIREKKELTKEIEEKLQKTITEFKKSQGYEV